MPHVEILNLWLYRILRISIGSVFIYSGVVKLADTNGFVRVISQFEFVPEQLLAPVALWLPVIELLAGAGLLFEIPGALTVIFGLLLMFVAVLSYGILNDLDIECGCFSVEEVAARSSVIHAFYRDLAMIGVCLYLYLYRPRHMKNGQFHRIWLIVRGEKRT